MNNKWLFCSLAITFLILVSPSLALAVEKDIAYIVKTNLQVDQNLLNKISSLGYTYSTVLESQISAANLSSYRMIIIGTSDLASPELIPINNHKTLVINIEDYFEKSGNKQLGLSKERGFASSPTLLKLTSTQHEITKDFTSEFLAYPSSSVLYGTSYLKGQKPSGIKILVYTSVSSDAVLTLLESGKTLLNGKVTKEEIIFFGVTYSSGWSTQSEKLFENILKYMLAPEDLDGDGFKSDIDCNDDDDSIYPGATEIPYDEIDQDCSGLDLTDVDRDGFDSEEVFGLDCNDFNSLIKPSSQNLSLNCVNDAPIIHPILFKSYNEGSLINITIIASDPEEDILDFDISDSRFIQNGNKFIWQTDFEDSGNYTFTIYVSDEEFTSGMNFSLEVKDINQPPQLLIMPNFEWEEDNNLTIDLSDYFVDFDSDVLYFGIEGNSSDKMINSYLEDNISITFVPDKDWNGDDWVVFFAYDGISKTLSNLVNLTITPFNDDPILIQEIQNITIDEDSSIEILNLSDYFLDIDSDLIFDVEGNSNINLSISKGLVKATPDKDWNGQEAIKFTASDGEFSIESNEIVLIVNDLPDIPHFNDFDCETEIDEDSSNSCALSAIEEDGDSLIFSIESFLNINCSISNNILEYYPNSDYNGPASCLIKVSDKDGFELKELNLTITPFNDDPILIQEIQNITIDEDSSIEILNLSDYFLDIDSDLIFDVEGNSNIDLDIQNGIVRAIPSENWNGEEQVTILASDEDFTIISNQFTITVNPIDDTPEIESLNCETEIDEDSSNSCALSAIEEDGDSLIFSIESSYNLNCTITNGLFRYSPINNYYGQASCSISVKDSNSFQLIDFNITVMPVNDLPSITSLSPRELTINLPSNVSKTFSLEATDVENSHLSKSWKLNGFIVYAGENYEFMEENPGIYTLEAEVKDSDLGISRARWTVIVGQTSEFTCSEVSGSICSQNEICSGSFIDVKDSSMCCSATCSIDPIIFGAAGSCQQPNPKLFLEVIYPSENSELALEDEINVRFRLKNNLNSTLNLKTEAILFNINKARSETSSNDNFRIRNGESQYLKMIIPAELDINDKDNYVILVKSQDGEICQTDYSKVKLERPSKKIEITDFDLPEEILCGRLASGYFKIENRGTSSQKVDVLISSDKLKIDENFSSMFLESFGEDDLLRKKFYLEIPESVKTGDYTVQITANSTLDKISTSKSIHVDCQAEIVSINSLEQLNSELVVESNNQVYGTQSKAHTNSSVVLLFLLTTTLLSLFMLFILLDLSKKNI